jgi:hypothetical protein
MLHAAYRRPISVLISQSKDGEIIASVFRYYGVSAVRGSSTRGGGAALRDMIRAAREGKNIVFTPDGPKGPPRVATEGLIVAAQATGLPIIPVAFAAKKKSSSAPGTAWSFRTRSAAHCSCTENQLQCRGKATSRSGGSVWRGRSMRWQIALKTNSMNSGKELRR